ncbi:hypothetical protein ACFXHD_25345 [Streptomyces hydrogenans]|uniref:hypothetical protein n=1 Tax=Streptomyces hydrogenans TaxID=1873719 RepID=UPI0036B0F566
MSICEHAPKLLTDLATELETACPTHGQGDEAWTSCHCEIAADFRAKAAMAAAERAARATTMPRTWRSAARQLGVSDDEYAARFNNGEKWCGGCRTWHDRSAFGLDRSRGDGLQPRCRKANSRAARSGQQPGPSSTQHTESDTNEVPA